MKNPVSSLCKRTYGIYIVPRLGLEPRCLAALVFETSASTYSAIWAKSSNFKFVAWVQRYNKKYK